MNSIKFIQSGGIEDLSKFGMDFCKCLNELIDNAIEAGAKNIIIILIKEKEKLHIIIIEDGMGMDSETLQGALTFGGENIGKIKEKTDVDLGKFHAGMPIAILNLCSKVNIFSNDGGGWTQNYLDKNELTQKGGDAEIHPSKSCKLPDSIKSIVHSLKQDKGLDLPLDKGTVLALVDIDKEVVNDLNFLAEKSKLYNNCCIRYFNYLSKPENSIFLMDNIENNMKKCEPINPLLDDQDLLENNGLEMVTKFTYENILTVKEVLPYSDIDGSMDITFTITEKKDKNDRMTNAHDLVKINMDNQGVYIARNNLVLISAETIGYNKRHNSMNGVRAFINVDGKWDACLGINVNKSNTNLNSKLRELLDERLKEVFKHIRKFKTGKEDFNPPNIEVKNGRVVTRKCIPIIEKYPPKKDNNSNKEKISIIFAASKEKPSTCASGLNGHNIKLDINKKNKSYYVYEGEVNKQGIKRQEIEAWCLNERISKEEFYKNVKESIGSNAKYQRMFYEYYLESIYNKKTKKDFFLFPEVYVQLNSTNNDYENKQRVDFLIVLPNNRKVIIEIDGIDHYAEKIDGKWIASMKKYTTDRKFDRKMSQLGYTIYRFSNSEIEDKKEIEKFFDEILK